jgi:hypothetical protein
MDTIKAGEKAARPVTERVCLPPSPTPDDKLAMLDESFFVCPQEGISLLWIRKSKNSPSRAASGAAARAD